jgi:hypothetical protein
MVAVSGDVTVEEVESVATAVGVGNSAPPGVFVMVVVAVIVGADGVLLPTVVVRLDVPGVSVGVAEALLVGEGSGVAVGTAVCAYVVFVVEIAVARASVIKRYLNKRTIFFIILAGFDVRNSDSNPAHQVQHSKVRHEQIRETSLNQAV